MHSLETDLHYLGVLDKTVAIAQELGSAAAVRYVRSSYQLLSKGYRPGLHNNQAAAEEGQKRLNAIKERLDWTSDEELARFLGASTRPADGHLGDGGGGRADAHGARPARPGP